MLACLACLCASCVLTCLACLRACVLTCLACLRTCVLACLKCLRASELTCLACSRAWHAYVLAKLCDPNIRKVESHVLSGPDFWLVWRGHGILCIYVCFSIFLFRSNVRRGYLDESDFRHCFGNFFESAIPKVS